MDTVRRSNTGWLQGIETFALSWLVKRLPRWTTPNLLTTLGFVGAAIVFSGYALARWEPGWLWLASAGFLINWFGDSLDGTLARYRKIERPKFGYFLDNTLDVIEQFMLAVGIGISGFIRWDLAFLALSVFLMISILSFVRATVSGEFRIAYGGMGLTEMRLAFVILNALMYFIPPQTLSGLGLPLSYPNLLSLTWSAAAMATFLISWLKQIREVAREDPVLD